MANQTTEKGLINQDVCGKGGQGKLMDIRNGCWWEGDGNAEGLVVVRPTFFSAGNNIE